MASFVKKAIPNEGFIEKVYIDTSLTKDEVVEFFSNYNYFQTVEYNGETCYTWGIYAIDENNYFSYTIDMHVENVFYLVLAKDGVEHKIFDSQTGWSEEILSNNEIVVNNNAIKYIKLSGVFNLYFGYNNEEWKNLFYIKGKVLKFKELKTKSSNNYDGNVVPNTGNIENVYFNTKLSAEEIVESIKSANLSMINVFGNDSYFLAVTNDYKYAFRLIINDSNLYEIRMMEVTDLASFTYTEVILFNEANGWSKKIGETNVDISVFPLNIGLISEYNGVSVGEENYKLANFFSSKPFTKDVGDVIETSELPTLTYQGTAVPNTGTIEKVYVNTNLSIEEVDSILSQIDIATLIQYVVVSNTEVSNAILLMGFQDTSGNIKAGILLADQTYIYIPENIPDAPFSGWNTEFNGVIEFNSEVISELNGVSIGTENSKLSSLFSTTPFVASGVDSESIYKVGSSEVTYHPYFYHNIYGGLVDLLDPSNKFGLFFAFVKEVETIEGIELEESSQAVGIKGYYVPSENIIYIYGDLMETGEKTTSNFGEMMDVDTILVKSTNEVVSADIYLIENLPKYYKYKNNEWVELVLGGYNTDYLAQKMNGTLKEYYSEEVTQVIDSCFVTDTSLEKIELPNCLSIGLNAFNSCSALKTVILDSCTSIKMNAFSYSSLTALVLGANEVCTIADTTALSNTPIANGTGYAYVTDSLVDSYKADSAWSTYASQIKPLSEYVEE